MKKILGTTLAAALLIPGPANAEILKNLKVNGQLDVQATSAQNVSDFSKQNKAIQNTGLNDRIGATITRVLVDLNWDLLDDVHSVVTLRKNDRAWGAAGGVGQGAGGSQAIGAGGVQANTFVDRAAITVDKLGGNVDLTVGRQYFGDSGDLIFHAGPKEGSYGLAVTAIDAFKFDWANDFVALTGLAATTAAGTVAAGTANTHIRGLDAMWKSLPMKAHTYVWNRVKQDNAGNTTGTDNLWVYGLKLRGEAMGGWLSADIAANGGIDRTSLPPGTIAATCGTAGCNANSSAYTGKALLIDAGYNAEMSGIGALTPWVNFGFGTGRSSNVEARNEGFTAIASDYRPGILNRRFDGNVRALGGAGTVGATNFHTNGLNNRVVYGAGMNFTPAAWEKMTAGLQLWSFNTQRNTHTNTLTAAGTQSGAKHIGTEIGFTMDWKHSENVKFGAGWSQFMTGGAIKQAHRNNTAANGTGINNASVVFGDLSVKF